MPHPVRRKQKEPTTIAIDLAKRVFEVHLIEPETGAIHSKVLKRAQLKPFFANRARCRVVMEACGGAHHWAPCRHSSNFQALAVSVAIIGIFSSAVSTQSSQYKLIKTINLPGTARLQVGRYNAQTLANLITRRVTSREVRRTSLGSAATVYNPCQRGMPVCCSTSSADAVSRR
jgi:transposase